MTVLAPLVVTLVLSPLHAVTPAPLYAAAPAAMDPGAKERFDRGLAGYQAKEYAAAIRDFRLAYALDPRGEILFAWAQAERMYGRCSQATKLYTRFLKGKPSAQQAGAARTGIDRCKDQPDTTPADPEDIEEQQKPVAEEKPPEPEPEPEPEPPPTRKPVDALGISLVTIGAALGVTGAALIGVAENKAQGAGAIPTYNDYSNRDREVKNLRISGGVVAGIGGALLIGGIVKLILHKRQNQRDVAFWTDPRGAGIIVRMRF